MNKVEQQFLNDLDKRLWIAADKLRANLKPKFARTWQGWAMRFDVLRELGKRRLPDCPPSTCMETSVFLYMYATTCIEKSGFLYMTHRKG